MFNRFVKDAREVARQAEEIARELASPAIEAEHLLLALTERPGTTAQTVLTEVGLDHGEVQEALDRENERSLAAVGVSAAAFDLSPAADAATRPRWATSAKLALERSLEVAVARDDNRIEPGHILLGLLQASVGTVPRALEGAGIDRTDVANRVEATLDRPG